MNKLTKHQREILKWIKNNPNKLITAVQVGAGKGKSQILFNKNS